MEYVYPDGKREMFQGMPATVVAVNRDGLTATLDLGVKDAAGKPVYLVEVPISNEICAQFERESWA